MTAQKGKDLLLKIDSDGAGTFQTVAGLRARRISFNAESVDVTDANSAGRWRELWKAPASSTPASRVPASSATRQATRPCAAFSSTAPSATGR